MSYEEEDTCNSHTNTHPHTVSALVHLKYRVKEQCTCENVCVRVYNVI